MSKKLRFVTVMGNVDLDLPNGQPFDLSQQVTAWRGAGYAMNDTFYIPITSILGVFVWDTEGMPPDLQRPEGAKLQ